MCLLAVHLQSARYESGLDNSPMYDGELFDAASHKMRLYDVGMSSLVAMEAQALADLARLLGRAADAAALDARAAALRARLAALWDPAARAFANQFPGNGTFSPRISPTSFYPLLARAATDAQAAAVVEHWLLRPDRFCVAPDGAFTGNRPECWWGLPSIAASDPAYPPLGYWRGYVWGPMAQLTYWALSEYAHVPVVRRGRGALARQMRALMLSQWRAHRHICENYNPHRNSTECSGTRFYHWGALTGLLALQERGGEALG